MGKSLGKGLLLVLIAAACTELQFNGHDWSWDFPGMGGGVGVLLIVASVILYRIYKAMRVLFPDYHLKYAWLIPVVFIAVCPHARYVGNMIDSASGRIPQWEFNWGGSQVKWLFLLLMITVIMLVNILRMLKECAPKQSGKMFE